MSLTLTNFELYLILLIVTISVLITIWTLSLLQLCATNINDSKRCRTILLVLLWTTISTIANTLVYSSSMFQNYKIKIFKPMKLSMISNIFEALYICIGFHIFRIFHLSNVQRIYSSMNLKPPKGYTYLFNIMQMIIFITV
eukprot:498897_1